MKKTYQLIISFSLAVIAICLGYTTYQSYIVTHGIINSDDSDNINLNINEDGLTSEQYEILELRVQIYELEKKLEQCELEKQITNEK